MAIEYSLNKIKKLLCRKRYIRPRCNRAFKGNLSYETGT